LSCLLFAAGIRQPGSHEDGNFMKRIFYRLVRSFLAIAFGLITYRSNAAIPVVLNILPTSAVNGSTISISGTNFSSIANSNLISFGAVRATVLAATPTNLAVQVPAGASYGPITVTVAGLTAYSSQFFQPTFDGGGGAVSTTNFTASFTPSFDFPVLYNPAATVIGDFDGDGKPDIAVVSGGYSAVAIYQNVGTNGAPMNETSFALTAMLDFPASGTGGAPYRIRAVDLDGDGKLDLVACEVGGNRVSVFHNVSVPGLLKTNSFEPAFALVAGADCRSVTAADLDGDGRVDIVALNYGDKTLSLFKNIGVPGILNAGSFASPVVLAAPGGPYEGVVVDLNGDGLPDLAVAESDSGTVSIFQNAGGILSSNTFPKSFDLSCGNTTGAIIAADLDGDGRPDLIAGSVHTENINIFQNVSNGGILTTNSFAPRLDFDTGDWTHVMAIADFNGDGKPDIAVVGEIPSTMSVFQNISTGGLLTANSLAARVDFGTGWNPWGVSAGDLNGDGRPDIAFCNDYDSTLEIYQNTTPPTPVLSIVSQPTNTMVMVNDTAVFNVVAFGNQPLSYQWNFNGTNLFWATNATLVLSNVVTSQAGNYSVVVSEPSISVTSSVAVLTVNLPPTPPAILYQTPGQVVAVSNTATFVVQATGSLPLSFQWSRNGVTIPAGTNTSYSLVNAQLSDSGSIFACLITNTYGFASSSNMLLKVIDTVPNGLCNNAIVVTSASYTNVQSTLKANAPGNPMPDCVPGFGHGVWYEFTATVSGILYVDTFGSDFDTGLGIYTGTCGAMSEVACNDDAAGGVTSQIILPTIAGTTYYIIAGGYNSDAGNLVFHLNYVTPPIITVQPTNVAVVVSSNASFTPTVTGASPISFQWYFNNAPLVDGGRISGATASTLNITNVQISDGGNYILVASNFVGVTTSIVSVLTAVILPPTFVQSLTNISVGLGSNAIFSVVMSGTPPYSYQWSYNGNAMADDGVHIAGSTTPTLTISNVTTADGGVYSLMVTNASGTANAAAILTVLAPPLIYGQPAGRSVPPGLPTVFAVSASGTPAPGFQWQFNGTNIPGATSATYTNGVVGTGNLGFYQVIASNLMGTATSSVAELTFGPVAAWGQNVNNECLPPPGLSNVASVLGTYQFSFATLSDGTVAAWGKGYATNFSKPVTNAVALSSDGHVSFAALQANGNVYAWGGPPAPTLSNIVSVALGNNFGCALRAEGSVVTWGTLPSFGFNSIATNLNHITAIAAGYAHALALRTDGTVVAWGNGAAANAPVGLSGVISVAAGGTCSLALRSNGRVVAWGTGTGTNVPAGLSNRWPFMPAVPLNFLT